MDVFISGITERFIGGILHQSFCVFRAHNCGHGKETSQCRPRLCSSIIACRLSMLNTPRGSSTHKNLSLVGMFNSCTRHMRCYSSLLYGQQHQANEL